MVKSLKTPVPKEHPLTKMFIAVSFIGTLCYYASFCTLVTARKEYGAKELIELAYFYTVTLWTVGYGDIVPTTTGTKIVLCILAVTEMLLLNIVFANIMPYCLEAYESYIRKLKVSNRFQFAFKHDSTFGHEMLRTPLSKDIRLSVHIIFYAGVFVIIISIWILGIHFSEKMDFIDSVYLAIMSATTIGYGDKSFKSVGGWIFVIIWLPISIILMELIFLTMISTSIRRYKEKYDAKIALLSELEHRGTMSPEENISEAEYILKMSVKSGMISEENVDLWRRLFNDREHHNS